MCSHIRISADQLICSSPQLFAACHVLRRRLMPRHPPYALISLIFQSLTSVLSLLVSFLTNISVLELQDIFYTPIVLVLCYLHLTLTISRIHIICFTMQLSMCFPATFSRAFRSVSRSIRSKKSITNKLVSSSIFYASGISISLAILDLLPLPLPATAYLYYHISMCLVKHFLSFFKKFFLFSL